MLQKIIDVLNKKVFNTPFTEVAQELLALFKSEVKQGLIDTYRNAKYQIAREVLSNIVDDIAPLKEDELGFYNKSLKWLDQQLEQEAEDKDMKDDLHEDLRRGG